MVTIIHGGHREGLCYHAAQTLKDSLEKKGEAVNFYSLRDYRFDFCCGNQPCQDSGTCIYSDVVTNEILPAIAGSKALVVFTPTYFNLPPAILKNFMDRCNLLLTFEERKSLHFGSWISGQTDEDEDSLEQCYQSLAAFAEIFEYEVLNNGRIIRVEQNVQQIELTDGDKDTIEKLATEIITLD